PFTGDRITLFRQWWSTDTSNPTDCQYYTFKHDARYLKIIVAMYADDTNAASRRSISDNLGNVIAQEVTYDKNDGSNLAKFGETLTIDLGVPTGQMTSVYVRLNAGNTGYWAYGRVISMWKEG